MKTQALLAVAGLMAVAQAESPWRDDLWLGRGSFWTSRVGIAVANPTDTAWEGRTVPVPVVQVPFRNARVEEVRLVDAQGVKLEYGVWTKGGTHLVKEGPLPPDGVFAIPVCCAARGTAAFTVYYGNAAAWGLADFWEDRPGGFVNGGFEETDEKGPIGWKSASVDPAHRMSVISDGAPEGRRCILAEADAGAVPSWFGYSQRGIPVRPGGKVRLHVRLRAENVRNGYAGWYVHAGNAQRNDILNKVFNAGGGTFGWKDLDMEVTIPADCTTMTIGSVLRGTGRAWFDDVRIEQDMPSDGEPRVTVGAEEKLFLREIGKDAPWPDATWQYRVAVRLANFTDADRPNVLAAFSLPEALHATRNPAYELTQNGVEIPTCSLGDRLLFRCTLPAKSVTTCYLYVRSTGKAAPAAEPDEGLRSALGSVIPSDQVLVGHAKVGDIEAFRALLDGANNLVKNASFEAGEAGWSRSRTKGVAFEIADGGRFGAKFAKMTIPVGVQPNWSGWRQVVSVTPGRAYFYGAFISGDDLTAGASVHVHLHDATGGLGTGGMQSAGRGVRGTVPWTPVFGTLTATEDTATVDLQLTMNGTGTVAHDGVVLTEYTAARTGDPEFAPAAADRPALEVAQVDSVTKVFRETPVEGADPATFGIALARNETEPLQFAVRSATGGRLELMVESPLAVEVGRVDYVPVDWPTAYYSCTTPEWVLRHPRNGGQSDGWSGWWPDPIVPERTADLAPNATQAFWLNFRADARTQPGAYAGKVLWKLDGNVVRTDPFTVKVWDFEIPARPRFAAVYDVRINGRWQGLGDTPEARREKIWAFMAGKKACPDTLGECVKFAKDKDGRVTADFTEYDKLATRYFDHYRFPASYMPHFFYCFGWAMPPKKVLGEDPYEGAWPYAGADWKTLRPAYKNVYQQALKLYWDHVKAKGWADRLTLYISDEPHFHHTNVVEQMKACCAMIHEVDPKIRIYSSTWRHCPEWNGSLDVWGVGHYGCFPVEEMKARKAAGDRIWWTTDGQMCTDTPYCAVERLLPHYAQKYGADLYEFWGCTWLTYDPWKYGWHAYIRQSDTPGKTYWVRYPAGDGYLIYPPKEGGTEPVTTVRMEAARDGVEDFCYLELLAARAKSDPAAAALLAEFRALVSIPNAGGRHSSRILPVPERINELRLRAGDLLSRR